MQILSRASRLDKPPPPLHVGYALQGPLSKGVRPALGGIGGRRSPCSIWVADREARQYFVVLFDKPVGQGKVVVEEVTVAEEPALEGKAKVVYRGGDPVQLRRARRLGLPENQEVQPAELAKGRVRRHHRIPTRQGEGGEIGVHPELG